MASLLQRPYGLKSKNMELKDVTAAEKVLFIKHCCSAAGKFAPLVGLRLQIFQNSEKFLHLTCLDCKKKI